MTFNKIVTCHIVIVIFNVDMKDGHILKSTRIMGAPSNTSTRLRQEQCKLELLRLEVNLRKCKGEGYYTSPFIEDFFSLE